ncbi:MAG: DNA-directed RNA polymerase subunit omega [Acidobacteriota bacterium]|jgi:DNA-directed RNA polymerase subunit omega
MFQVSQKVGSKFRFVVLGAQRARQLMDGAEPRVETEYEKPAFVALRELQADKLKWEARPAEGDVGAEPGDVMKVEAG